MNLDDNFLNDVDITSNIRAPGEYKYYYCGENNSESDKSFLAISSMWYNDKISSDMEIICSCHNSMNTAQLFLDDKTNAYSILIYKNIIDYRNENMILKLIHQVNLTPNFQLDINTQIQIDKRKVKIFLVGKNYLVINIIDFNILLLDYTNGNFITIFARTFEEKETLFNIIDTYDEPYMLNGEQKIRSYLFLSKKSQERKTPTYSYKYVIIQKDVFKLKNFLLHSIDFDLGNAEPLGLKIGKIFMPESNGLKFCFIFIFISSSTLFQLVTDYDNLNLHNMLKKNSRVENNKESDEEDNNNNTQNKSNSEKDNKDANNINNNSNKLTLGNNDFAYNKTKYWTIKRKIEAEKKNITQCIKFILSINDKRICSFVLFFESKYIVSYNFNYTDTPEEIMNKIFVTCNINLSLELTNFEKIFKPPAHLYQFAELYLFKSSSFFDFSRNNLIMCDRSKLHIYSLESKAPIYTYEFYKEDLSLLISIEGLGSTFLLTGNKLFKIIYNERFMLFSDEKIFDNWKTNIKYYKTSKKLSFPVFEFQPEDIWNAYCSSLGLEKYDFNEIEILNIKEDSRPSKLNKKYNTKNAVDKYCSLCGVKSEKSCADCNMRFYCCESHFQYDFYTFHFFECQWIQFFNRKDIMNIPDKEIRYKILYNELIKVCGRILTYIFMRIYTKKDYQFFLNMILTMLKILDNFGFKMNLSEFCNCNYTLNERVINRHQKIIFYQEALFFYVQLHFLKCTFTLKSNLYNLTDCYLKIIKNDIIPLLTPKMNKRLISLKCEKRNIDVLYNNQYFNEFNSELFFDIEKFVKNNSAPNNSIDLVEEYIIKHLMSLSLLAKFKKKIGSSMEVQNSFVNINLMFDDHFNESEKKIVAYCYFFTSFYLVEIGKVTQTVKLLKRIITIFTKLDNDVNILKYLTHFNLGVVQYALGNFDIGIHNMETALKLIIENNFSDKIKLKVLDSLSLAYLNKRHLYKAFILIKKSIQERKMLNKKGDEIDSTRLNVYLNYINDLYEYTFISKARLLTKKKYKNIDKKKLMKFVLGEEDKEMVISEQDISQFIKVAKFVWDLPENVLRQLNIDNPPKVTIDNIKEEQHHDRSISFNSEISVSMTTTTYFYKDNANEKEKEDMEEDYEEEIEIKTNLYDTFSQEQKQNFAKLKTIYLKRDIILRDSLGEIEKFNINYEPVFANEFERIIEKLKSNFLLKEIFYCFQNEKWRDELYNYTQNNILFGLSKYLKMEKIKNMLAIEKTKILEAVRQKKLRLKQKLNNKESNINNDNNSLLIDDKNKVVMKETDIFAENLGEKEIDVSNDISSGSSSDYSNEEGNAKGEIGINYTQFKAKFVEALTELEKEKGNNDLYEFLNFDEDYLYSLYISVFKNNPDYKFILQNPLLILNYIFIEINKRPEIEIKKSDIEEEINILKKPVKTGEKKIKEIKGIEEEKKESEEDEEKNKFNSSSYSNNNPININNLNEEEKEQESNKESNEFFNEDEKQENEENNEEEDNKKKEEENVKKKEEEIKFLLNIKNPFMEQFEKEENIYDYIRDEINETREITLEYNFKKESITPPPDTMRSERKNAKKVKSRKSSTSNTFIRPLIQDIKNIDPKSLIEEADQYLKFSKELSKQQEDEKTFALIQKNNRRRTQPDVKKININLNLTKSNKEEEKTDSLNHLSNNKRISYMQFINKTKKSTRKTSKKNSKKHSLKPSQIKKEKEKEEKPENDNTYFDLKKEMALNESKARKKRREHNYSMGIVEKDINIKQKKGRIKIEIEKNYYEQYNSNSFEKILKNKNVNKNKSLQENKSKSKNKIKGKNISFKFKNKEEIDKDIESGALLYLKNEYKSKNKNNKNINNTVLNGKPNRNKNNIIIKKRIFKSTDEKKINNINKSDIDQENYIYIPKNKVKNRNKKKGMKKEIKINSSTTLNSTSIEYNSNNAKKAIKQKKDKNNNANKNKNNIKNEKGKKNKSDIFSKEYKKIIEYNKRKKNLSQDKNCENNYLRINLDNHYESEFKSQYTDNPNKTSRYQEYHGTSPAKYQEDKYNNLKTRDKKLYPIGNNYKKNNFIPTTNYTNSESPGNTRFITFQGRGNNIGSKPISKEKY